MIHWISLTNSFADNYADKLSAFLIPTSSAYFIFVLGATFILLQENYHKFNSTVFFRFIIKRCFPSVFISILLLVASFVVQLFSISNTIYIFVCALSLLFGVYSFCRMLFFLRKFLDYQYVIERVLFPNVKQKEIEAYVSGNVSKKENCIDSSLKLVLGSINNDTIATESVFVSIFEWFYTNWERFELGKNNSQQNKFIAFLTTIDESVLACDNFTIQANYLNALYNCIFKKIKLDRLESFKQLYHNLKAFALRGFDKNVDKSILLSSVDILLSNTSEYLDEIKKDSEYKCFDSVVWKCIKDVIRKAIRLKDYAFLRNIKLFDGIFSKSDTNKNTKWNCFYKSLLNDYLILLFDISSSIEDDDTFTTLLFEIQLCDWMVLSQDSGVDDDSINALLNLSQAIFENYINALKNKIGFYSFTFLFQSIMIDDYKMKVREKSIDRLFFIIDYFFSVVFSDNQKECFRLLARVDKVIRLIEGKDDSYSVIFDKLKRNREMLVSKYKEQLSGYNDFLNSDDVFLKIMRDSPLFI